MTDEKRKQFGLIKRTTTKVQPTSFPTRGIPKTNIFGSDSESEDEEKLSKQEKYSRIKVTANNALEKATTKMIHEQALAEDPSIFDYDLAYEEMQERKTIEEAAKRASDNDRTPKYIDALLKNARAKELEFIAHEDRVQAKEREQEGELYKDKETFVTNAYRQKMEELDEFRKEQEYKDRLDDYMDVKKQGGLSGFYRNLLNDLTSDNRNAKLISSHNDQAEKLQPEPNIATPKALKKYKKPERFEDDDEYNEPLSTAKSDSKDKGSKQRQWRKRRSEKDSDNDEEDDDDIRRRRSRSRSTASDSSFTGKEIVSSKPKPKRRRDSSTPEDDMPINPMMVDVKKTPINQMPLIRLSESPEPEKDNLEKQPIKIDADIEETKEEMKDIKPKEDIKQIRRRKLRELLAHHKTPDEIEEMKERYFKRIADKIIEYSIPI